MGFRYPDAFTDNLEEMLLEGKGKEGKGVVRGGERREKRGEERMVKNGQMINIWKIRYDKIC